MQTTIQFKSKLLRVSEWSEGASVPFISEMDIQQNRIVNELPEGDPLDIGFGKISTIYPYTQQNVYTRELKEKEIEIIELENDYLKATFIPSLGGKLWSLYDKVKERELLYVNDVIRPSNLAVRNAWVSGGVEWNIGVIGHSPFTCSQLFVSTLEVGGMPIVRMYEYERIRKVTYQMDFFLPEKSPFLLCRMRIVNPNKESVPMYWWSNIAVPELNQGRLVVEADSAYTNTKLKVHKVEVPIVNGVDISYPIRIPQAVDYFFDVPSHKRKFITHLDETGYGLVQTSTSRLQGRKLFVWGQTNGSKRWQQFLTDNAGPYIEIQAGLAKTQYECLPMQGESEWEWIEAYGAMKVESHLVAGDWNRLKKEVNKVLEERLPEDGLEALLHQTKEDIALKTGMLVQKGSIFGSIENYRRELSGEGRLSKHLDFGDVNKENEWISLLNNHSLGVSQFKEEPSSYMMQDTYYDLLETAVQGKDKKCAYTWYHLGLNHLVRGKLKEAKESLECALKLEESAFIYHALAILNSQMTCKDEAIKWSIQAIKLRKEDIGLVKDCMGILLDNKGYSEILKMIKELSKEIRENTRIKAYEIYAYAQNNEMEMAKKILGEKHYIEVEDLREGEVFLTQIWDLMQSHNAVKESLPFALDFRVENN